MNRSAESHLAKAEKLLAKGDDYYGKAADEIIAAQKADPTLSNRQVGDRFGRHHSWVAKLVTWRTSGASDAPPFARANDPTVESRNVKLGLSKMSGEEVDRLVHDLPAKKAAQLAQAALEAPGVTRELAKDAEASATVIRASGKVAEDMERKARSRSTIGRTSGLDYLVEVQGNLHGAKRRLSDSYKAACELELNDDHREAVTELLDEIVLIIDWFRSYLDSGDQSFEDELSRLLKES